MKEYFLPGLVWLACVGMVFSQEGGAFALEGEEQERVKAGAKDFTVTFEVFSVPMAKAAEMRRSGEGQGVLYQELVTAVKEGMATHDKFMEIRGKEGLNLTIEQVREYIYPTEYDPPDVATLPRVLPEGFKDFDKFITPAMPTSFERRNLGDTVEVKLEADPDRVGILKGRLVFTHVALTGELEWGEKESKVKMPQFEVQKINSAMSLTLDEPLFAGALSDPSTAPEKKGHVWLAFVTVSQNRVGGK